MILVKQKRTKRVQNILTTHGMTIPILNTLKFFPFLSMACHLICNPIILNGQCNLFEGSGQYERFNRIFLEILGHPKYRQIFIAFRMPPEEFGTHSIRKGAVTFVATGCTTCPPIASICLRANWEMPSVMNCYIKYESAGYQRYSSLNPIINPALVVLHLSFIKTSKIKICWDYCKFRAHP